MLVINRQGRTGGALGLGDLLRNIEFGFEFRFVFRNTLFLFVLGLNRALQEVAESTLVASVICNEKYTAYLYQLSVRLTGGALEPIFVHGLIHFCVKFATQVEPGVEEDVRAFWYFVFR